MSTTVAKQDAPERDEGADIAKRRASEARRAEQKLGVPRCAPAVVVMRAVTASPIL